MKTRPQIPMHELGAQARARHRLIEMRLHPLKDRVLHLRVVGQLEAVLRGWR